MASHFVKEEQRKHRYTTRACTYHVQRITEPMDPVDREYRSIREMSEELQISDYSIRNFVKSHVESQYIRSRKTGILYLLKRPTKDVAITARCIEYENDEQTTQQFTSLYQLVKRFKVSYDTVAKMRKMQPIGQECIKPINDEFRRKYLLTFYK